MGDRRRKWVFAAIFSVFLTFVSYDPTAAQLPVTPPSAREPIRIAVLASLTGWAAYEGQATVRGAELYFRQRNFQVAGRPVKFIVQDSAGRPDMALTAARKLVEQEKVHVVMGIVISSEAYAIKEYLATQAIPLVITGFATAERLTMEDRTPYLFRVTTNATQANYALGEWAYRKGGYRRAILFGSDTAGIIDNATGFARSFTESGGKVVKELYAPPSTTDYGPYLATVASVAAQADVVASAVSGIDAIRFAEQYESLGLKKRLPLLAIHGGAANPPVVRQAGEKVLGVVSALPYIHVIDAPENRAFVTAYQTTYKDEPYLPSEASYTGAALVAQAIEAVNGKIEDKEAFLRALRRAEVRAPRGRVRFDRFQNIVHDIYVYRVEKRDGQLTYAILDRVPEVGQFGKWAPEEYMKLPKLLDLKGTFSK